MICIGCCYFFFFFFNKKSFEYLLRIFFVIVLLFIHMKKNATKMNSCSFAFLNFRARLIVYCLRNNWLPFVVEVHVFFLLTLYRLFFRSLRFILESVPLFLTPRVCLKMCNVFYGTAYAFAFKKTEPLMGCTRMQFARNSFLGLYVCEFELSITFSILDGDLVQCKIYA